MESKGRSMLHSLGFYYNVSSCLMNLTNCLYSPADDIIAYLKQGGKQSKLTLVVDAPPAVCSRVAAQALVLFPGHVFGPLQDRNVLQKTSPEGRLLDPTPDAVSALLRTEQGTRRRVVVKPHAQTTFSTTAAKTSVTQCLRGGHGERRGDAERFHKRKHGNMSPTRLVKLATNRTPPDVSLTGPSPRG